MVDTPILELAARRITLCRRTGGTNHGWHLKVPARDDRRKDLHAPLGQPDTVPEKLTDHLRVYTRIHGELRDAGTVRIKTTDDGGRTLRLRASNAGAARNPDELVAAVTQPAELLDRSL